MRHGYADETGAVAVGRLRRSCTGPPLDLKTPPNWAHRPWPLSPLSFELASEHFLHALKLPLQLTILVMLPPRQTLMDQPSFDWYGVPFPRAGWVSLSDCYIRN